MPDWVKDFNNIVIEEKDPDDVKVLKVRWMRGVDIDIQNNYFVHNLVGVLSFLPFSFFSFTL